MKRVIEFEEMVKIKHRVIVEVTDDNEIDNICELTGNSFDEILMQIEDNTNAKILEINENYVTDGNGLEFYDDYWTDNEEKRFHE